MRYSLVVNKNKERGKTSLFILLRNTAQLDTAFMQGTTVLNT